MSDKRAELERAATSSVQASGLSNLSFRTLAQKVGIKSSSVHYYFPDKADLAACLIESYTKQFAEKLERIVSRKLELKKKLLAFAKIFETVLREDQFCLCGIMATEIETLDERSRKLLVAFFNFGESWLEIQIKTHYGEVQIDMTPVQLAKAIMTGLEGAIILDRVSGGTQHMNAQKLLISKMVS